MKNVKHSRVQKEWEDNIESLHYILLTMRNWLRNNWLIQGGLKIEMNKKCKRVFSPFYIFYVFWKLALRTIRSYLYLIQNFWRKNMRYFILISRILMSHLRAASKIMRKSNRSKHFKLTKLLRQFTNYVSWMKMIN